MANTVIPKNSMMVKKAIDDPRDKWTMLGSDKWKYDMGLLKHLQREVGERSANYYFDEKRHKKLWDLITYTDDQTSYAIIEYYEFPLLVDIKQFLLWAFNHVATDNDWKAPKGGDQMDYFPYEQLLEIYKKGG